MILLLVAAGLARPVDPSTPEARLTGPLADAWHASAEEARFSRFVQTHPDFTPDVQVVVVLRDAATGDALADRLGLDVEARHADLLQVRIPAARLGELAAAPEVAHVRQPFRPSAKETVSEGYEKTMLQDWHQTGPYTGTDVAVGILDVGFDGYDGLLGSELPDAVDSDLSRGASQSSDHGTAVAEVVHDFAPDATLNLVSFGTDVEFGEGLQTLLDAQVDVVNASVGFDNTWSLDGSSTLSRSADAMVDAGIIYIGAAGNENLRYRVGELANVSGTQYIEIGDHYAIRGSAPNGRVRVSFRWSEPFGKAVTDLDLVVFDADTERECGRSETPQNGDDDPYEEVSVSDCGENIYAAVYAEPGTDVSGLTGWLHNAHGLDTTELTHVSTLSLPGDCLSCLAIGAVVDDTIADYSSRGPTEDGRVKPDFVGPSDVSTETLGEKAFTGSSAAAPHVAGLAALWVDATNIHDDPAGFELWEADEAKDLGDNGADNTYGGGAVRADQAPGCGCSGAGAAPSVGLAALTVGMLARRRRR